MTIARGGDYGGITGELNYPFNLADDYRQYSSLTGTGNPFDNPDDWTDEGAGFEELTSTTFQTDVDSSGKYIIAVAQGKSPQVQSNKLAP